MRSWHAMGTFWIIILKAIPNVCSIEVSWEEVGIHLSWGWKTRERKRKRKNSWDHLKPHQGGGKQLKPQRNLLSVLKCENLQHEALHYSLKKASSNSSKGTGVVSVSLTVLHRTLGNLSFCQFWDSAMILYQIKQNWEIHSIQVYLTLEGWVWKTFW